MALIVVGASTTIFTAGFAIEYCLDSTKSFILNKNIREKIQLFQENWDALYTKNNMLKEFLKNSLLPNINKVSNLLNELVIFQNQLLIEENRSFPMFFLGSDRTRSILLNTLNEMKDFICQRILCEELGESGKKSREYLEESREEFTKCTRGTGNLSKVIYYHNNGIRSLITQSMERYIDPEIRAQINEMKRISKNIIENYRDGYQILDEIIKIYSYIEYLITPTNDKLIIKDTGTLILGYFDLLHMGMFVSKFNSFYHSIKASYSIHKNCLIFESSDSFKIDGKSTFRTILGFEEDIESQINECGKHIIRFNNVKQMDELETLRARTKAERLNTLIELFREFKEKFGF